jgi:hydrogenase/urease accessory protein HupE
MIKAFLFCSFCLIGSHGLLAHEMRPAYLEIREIADETFSVTWKVPAAGSDLKLKLDVRLSPDCQVLVPTAGQFIKGAIVEKTTIRRGGGLAGTEVYIEGLSVTFTDVLLRYEAMDGTSQVARITPDDPSCLIETSPGGLEVARTYTVLGIEHIWKGIDHLLFVVCLMMVAGTRRKLIATITGFTIAHSFTLVLSTLDIVRLPVAPVEAVIALSIVFVATEIARGDQRSLTHRYPITVSSTFGLLHGFGFAAVLAQIGLPQQEIPVSLLFFNIGVEIGQILFVLAVITGFKVIRLSLPKWSSGAQLVRAESLAVYTIGALASYWMIDRIAGFWA